MAIWNRRSTDQLFRESADLRDQLLLAAAKLDVFVAALHVEVESDNRGAGDENQRTTRQQRPADS